MCDKLKSITSICQKCKEAKNGKQMGTKRKAYRSAKDEKHVTNETGKRGEESFLTKLS